MPIGKKKLFAREQIISKFGGDIHNPKCVKSLSLLDMMAESNIPAGYWFMKMNSFTGSDKLKDIASEYMSNIKENFINGQSLCFAGNQGTGKTMSAICILKTALKVGFSTYYTTASDMMAEMTDYKNNHSIRNTLRKVDFLVLDEVDSRFFSSDAQKELFSGIYENIFRYRSHNLLPTIICTNETNNILDVFYGASIQSIRSLNDQYLKIYPVTGIDLRKQV